MAAGLPNFVYTLRLLSFSFNSFCGAAILDVMRQ